jgi:hypothetical protein
MKYSILTGTVLGFLFLSSQVRGEEKIVVNPVGHFQANMADLVEVPGVSGIKAVQVKGAVPMYGWCSIYLGRTFKAGQYNIEYTISTQLDNAAGIALYTSMDQNQSQITGVHQCAKGQVYKLQTAFYSPIDFSEIAVKKISQDKNPGVAVSQITLTDLGRKEFPRLCAYQAVMSYAAPWGLRSEAMEKSKEVGEIEAWLDLRSGATEPFSRADYLFRVIRAKKLSLETAGIQKTLDAIKAHLEKNDLKDIPALLTTAEKDLNTLQSELEKKLDAGVCPETGTDLFTWIKAWQYVGVVGDYEYCEPTAYRAVYPDFQLGLIKPGEKADLSSTWTTSTYTTNRLTARYSVLTPMTVTDLHEGVFDMAVTVFKTPNAAALSPANTPVGVLSAPKGWFALNLQNSILLFVLNHEASKIEWTGSRLTIDFNNKNISSAVGYFVLPAGLKNKVPDVAQFYQRVLLHQPVECVQLQRGDKIEQTFEYVDRASDWANVKPLTIAPVPHLAMLSREPMSAFHVKADSLISRSPNNFGYVKNSSTLTYRLAAMPSRHNLGANVFDDENTTKEMFQELRQHGCQTVRQLTRTQMPWSIDDKKSVEKMKAFVQERLKWAREIGLKVGIDYHGGWDTTSLKILPEFIATWKELISWCKGYEDVVAWYDLLNEPGVFPDQGQPTKPYFEFMRRAVKALRPVAGKTPILVEGVSMANPGGLNYWEDFSDKNVVVGYHDYWPHLFTHQLTVEKGNASYPHAFYPSFMPMMEWTVPSWRNECPAWHYWDRWKRDSVSEPAIRLIIQKGVWVDCGEYGVVGYAGDVCKRSGVLWMRHALELYKRMNISHCAFSPAPNSGFTWLIPEFKEETYRLWKKFSVPSK